MVLFTVSATGDDPSERDEQPEGIAVVRVDVSNFLKMDRTTDLRQSFVGTESAGVHGIFDGGGEWQILFQSDRRSPHVSRAVVAEVKLDNGSMTFLPIEEGRAATENVVGNVNAVELEGIFCHEVLFGECEGESVFRLGQSQRGEQILIFEDVIKGAVREERDVVVKFGGRGEVGCEHGVLSENKNVCCHSASD